MIGEYGMKRSEEVLGLSIISISDGREVGQVKDLVVNPDQGAVECLVVENGNRYLGVKVIPFKELEGVGEYAVTVASESAIVDLSEVPHVSSLMERNVQIKGTKVLTKKGRLVGEVSEYIVDEDSSGQITGCLMFTKNGINNNKFIPRDSVVTFGKEILIVVEGVEQTLEDGELYTLGQSEATQQEVTQPVVTATVAAQTATSRTVDTQPIVEPTVTAPELKSDVNKSKATPVTQTEDQPEENAEETSDETPAVPDAAKLFEQRQRQYMIGRKVSKQIADDGGNVLAEIDETITEELIDKVKAAGKWSELTLNTKN
ncbi:MAG: PRC-barrel domain-containing protein [Carboxydocellales bacterium]